MKIVLGAVLTWLLLIGNNLGHAGGPRALYEGSQGSSDSLGVGEPLRGLLVASQEAILSSELAGRLLEIRHEVRQRFKKGDILIQFHCPDREARLQKAKAQLDAINKRLDVHRKLVELRSTSLLDVELIEAERLGAVAEVAMHKAAVEQCTLYAPFAGRIAERLVKPFESVNAGQPLVDIVGDAPFEVHVILPSTMLSVIKQGTPISIILDETKGHYRARVSGLGGRINPAGQTVRVVARMETVTDDLLPGMSGPVVVETEPLDARPGSGPTSPVTP